MNGFAGGLELTESSLKLFPGIRADLCMEKHDKDIALTDGAVVFVLQPGLRHGVEEVLPDDQFKKHAFGVPIRVFSIDENRELVAVRLEFVG